MIIFDLDGTLANCEHRRHLEILSNLLRKYLELRAYILYGDD